jgi:cyclic lactone autoinducer peptide
MFKKVFRTVFTLISALALTVAVNSVSMACFFFVHQPDVPDGLKKYEV